MTPEDGQGMMGWVKKDPDKLFTGLDEVRQEVARLSTKFERYVQPCADFRNHLEDHERRETRWWGFWLRVMTQLVTAAVGAGVAMAANGNWPWK
jgi:hypothetical protein